MRTPKLNNQKDMDAPAQSIQGIGPKRAEMLAAHGIRTVGDLLEYIPFRYEDRTQFHSIRSLREEQWVLIRGEVFHVGSFKARKRGFSVLEMLVRDGSGGIRVKFFNQPYLRRIYQIGVKLIIYGQAKKDTYARGSLVLLTLSVKSWKMSDPVPLSIRGV
jgi:ATP-dependent DNA helicase RecG